MCCRIEQRRSDVSTFYQRYESSQQNVLRLEARFVVRIGNDVEDIAKEVKEVLLIELVGNVR